jgi:hypothetical protein
MNLHMCYRCRPRRTPVSDSLRAQRCLDRAEAHAKQGDREQSHAAMRDAEGYARRISKTHADESTIEMFIRRTFNRMLDIVHMLRDHAEQTESLAS